MMSRERDLRRPIFVPRCEWSREGLLVEKDNLGLAWLRIGAGIELAVVICKGFVPLALRCDMCFRGVFASFDDLSQHIEGFLGHGSQALPSAFPGGGAKYP